MIQADTFLNFDPSRVPSPCFVVDEAAVERNLKILARVKQESGAKVLLALKAFSMFSLAPLVCRYLDGTCASGLHEARLGHGEFGGKNIDNTHHGEHKEVHTFSAAFTEKELVEVLKISDHVVFNSLKQWQRFQPQIQAAKAVRPHLRFGLRINPRHSEGTTAIYDPCAPGSRLGITLEDFKNWKHEGNNLNGISGLHFHTLCEQGFEPLDRTLSVIEEQFGEWLPQLEWINFGGGHHITAPDYNVDALIERIKSFSKTYDVQVYLEPGEAIAIRSGVLVSEVLDLTHNAQDLAILDTSATCHMPDILEMPYRANIFDTADSLQPYAGIKDEKLHSYRLGGQTCLAGDVMGDYSFSKALQLGDRIMFDDMAHYTMVKTSTFNGINLPSIALWNSETDELKLVKEFGYQDFKNRLS